VITVLHSLTVLETTKTELDRNEEIVCWQLLFWWAECDDGLGYTYRGVVVSCPLYVVSLHAQTLCLTPGISVSDVPRSHNTLGMCYPL
jgi:hypothetical protein